MFLIEPEDILFLVTILQSLNPFSYGILRERTLFENLKYVFSLVFVCLIASAILFVPFIMASESRVSSGLSNFEKLGFSYESSPRETVSAEVFGINYASAGSSDSALVVVEDDRLVFRSVFCAELSPLCRFYPEKALTRDDLADLSDNSAELSGLLRMMLVMSLPGFFVFSIVFYLVKYIAIAALSGLLGFLLASLFRFRINLNSSFAIACYSLTALIVPEILGSALGISLSGLEWFLFGALFVSGIVLSGRERGEHGRGRSAENKHIGKGAA